MGIKLHTNTPLANAVFNLLGNFDQKILEKHKNAKKGAVRVYIFGGCAVHFYTNARSSNDLDAEVEAADYLNIEDIIVDLDEEYFEDDYIGESSLYFDSNFNTAIASVSDTYQEDSHPLETGNSVLHVYLISAVDIAVSKLSRLATDDLKDIISLYKAKCFTLKDFKAKAQSALDYSATPDSLQKHIEHATIKLQECIQ